MKLPTDLFCSVSMPFLFEKVAKEYTKVIITDLIGSSKVPSVIFLKSLPFFGVISYSMYPLPT